MKLGVLKMRRQKVLACAALVLAALPTSAQSSPGIEAGKALALLIAPVMNLIAEPVVTGEPYTATRVTTKVQKLQDGTTISHHGQRMMVRDNEGRVRQQRWLVDPTDTDTGVKMVYIKDPVKKTLTMWTEGGKGAKVAVQIKLPEVKTTTKANDSETATNKNNRQVEELGQQSMQGILVTGERITHVIPAGRDGNDQPITTTNEKWTSPDLQLLVKEVYNDPRTGMTTIELQDISREDPPIARFMPPAGYAVKDNEQAMKDMQDRLAAAQSQ